MLVEEQAAFYADNGYLIIPDMFRQPEIELMKKEAMRFHDEDYSVLLNVHRRSPLFLGFATDERIISIVRQVMAPDIQVTNDQYLFKIPGTPYAKQSWQPHQDSAYTQALYNTYMQVHIFLDAQAPDNGGLYMFPGSHKEKLLPYKYAKSWREPADADGITRPGWECDVPGQYKQVDLTADAGSIFLQHGNLIHGSHPNVSRRSRQQYSIAYLVKGSKINKGQTSIKIPMKVK